MATTQSQRAIDGKRHTHEVGEDTITAVEVLTAAPSTSLTPDAPADEGVSDALSRADHRHNVNADPPLSLSKTSTSDEGGSFFLARSDHVHGTRNLPWGIVAYQSLTAGSAAFAGGATTDFSLTNVSADVSRLYRVNLNAQFDQSATGNWQQKIHGNGTAVGQVHAYNTASGHASQVSGSFLWTPATGTYTLDVRLVNVVGGGTFTYAAAATNPRQFWVEDLGPR